MRRAERKTSERWEMLLPGKHKSGWVQVPLEHEIEAEALPDCSSYCGLQSTMISCPWGMSEPGGCDDTRPLSTVSTMHDLLWQVGGTPDHWPLDWQKRTGSPTISYPGRQEYVTFEVNVNEVTSREEFSTNPGSPHVRAVRGRERWRMGGAGWKKQWEKGGRDAIDCEKWEGWKAN